MDENKIKKQLASIAISNPDAIMEVVKYAHKDTDNFTHIRDGRYLIYLHPIGSGRHEKFIWSPEEFLFARE